MAWSDLMNTLNAACVNVLGFPITYTPLSGGGPPLSIGCVLCKDKIAQSTGIDGGGYCGDIEVNLSDLVDTKGNTYTPQKRDVVNVADPTGLTAGTDYLVTIPRTDGPPNGILRLSLHRKVDRT